MSTPFVERLLSLMISVPVDTAHCQLAAEVSISRLEQQVQETRTAFEALNPELFEETSSELLDQLSCVVEPISPVTAAQIHQVEALHAFLQRDYQSFNAHVLAANSIRPDQNFPIESFPIPHPLRDQINQASLQYVASPQKIRRPFDGDVWIDGVQQSSIPTNRPYIFQYCSPDHQSHTILLGALEEPEYPKWSLEPLNISLEPKLTALSGGMGTLALVYMGMAFSAERQFWDLSTPQSELQGLYTKTRVRAGVATTFGTLSLLSLSGAVIVGRF